MPEETISRIDKVLFSVFVGSWLLFFFLGLVVIFLVDGLGLLESSLGFLKPVMWTLLGIGGLALLALLLLAWYRYLVRRRDGQQSVPTGLVVAWWLCQHPWAWFGMAVVYWTGFALAEFVLENRALSVGWFVVSMVAVVVLMAWLSHELSQAWSKGQNGSRRASQVSTPIEEDAVLDRKRGG